MKFSLNSLICLFFILCSHVNAGERVVLKNIDGVLELDERVEWDQVASDSKGDDEFYFSERQSAVYAGISHDDVLDEARKSGLILNNSESDWDIIKSIPRDAWDFITAPDGWDKEEWAVATGVVTITALLMRYDDRIRDFFQENKNEFTQGLAEIAEMGGDENTVIGVGAAYLVGTILKNPKLKKASVLAFSSLLISGALTEGAKYLAGRERPNKGGDQWQFHGPQFGGSHMSFPSGHTTAAFALAASFSTVYDSKIVKILAYTAATLVGLSRIHDNKHWASDVFMGAVIGTATGVFVTKKHLNTHKPSYNVGPWIQEHPNGKRSYGIQVQIPLGSK